MKPKTELIGKKFGRLFILEDSGERTSCGGVKYKCQCDCGNLTITARSDIIHGRAVSCGCYRTEKLREIRASSKGKPNHPNRKYKTNEERYQNYVYRKIKQRAKSDEIEFDLTYEQVLNLIKSRCYYCGNEGSNRMNVRRFSEDYSYKYNGIDRINSSKGYVLGNVVSCCKWCNQAKSVMSQKDFYHWIQQVSKNFTFEKIINVQ